MMSSGRSHNRFSARIDCLFWLVVSLLPILCYLIMYWSNGTSVQFMDFVSENFAFDFVLNILNDVTVQVFDSGFVLNPLISYFVGVEVFRVFFYVIVFIPRFAQKVVAKAVNFD